MRTLFTSSTLQEHRRQAAEASHGISSHIIYDLYEHIIQEKKLSGDVLDFGAGIGFLTQRLNTLDCFRSITAVDLVYQPRDVKASIRWIQADLNDVLPFPDHSFDLICCCEVISCLENPRALAREWFRLLRPGGWVILSTPNNESWRSLAALLWQGHFVNFGQTSYPMQKTALLGQDIQRIFQEAGFWPATLRYTNDGGLPKWPRITWQQISAGLLRGRRFSDNVLAIAQCPDKEGKRS